MVCKADKTHGKFKDDYINEFKASDIADNEKEL